MAAKTMNISLTEHWQGYVEHHLRQGRYQNASELVREALRLHERAQIVRDVEDVVGVFGASDRPETKSDIAKILEAVTAVRKRAKGRR